MANILKELELTELSLVDVPANPEALAPIYKAHSEKGENTMEDTIKMSDKMKERMKYYMEEKGMSEEAARKACMSEADKALTENESLRKALLDNGFKITKDGVEKKAPAEYVEVEGEQILKSDIPAPILKRLEEAEEEKAQAAVEKKAEGFQNISKTVAVKLVKMDVDQDEELLEFLRAVDAMFEKTMESAGETNADNDMGSAEDKLEGLSKAYAKEHNTTFHKAYAKVVETAEGKALLKAMKEDK